MEKKKVSIKELLLAIFEFIISPFSIIFKVNGTPEPNKHVKVFALIFFSVLITACLIIFYYHYYKDVI